MNPARFALAFLFVAGTTVKAEDWTSFRGPRGDGAGQDKDLPGEIKSDNILWKLKLPGLGTSTPITVGDKIFLTCYSGYGTTITKGMTGFGGGGFGKGTPGKGGKGGFGKDGPDSGGDQKKLRLHVLCIDRDKKTVDWNKEIMPKLPEASWSGFIREHGYASSTPVTDGKAIYAFFGKSGVVAFDLDGNKLWEASVGARTDKWGSGASPILYKDMVIVNASIESGSLIALDKNTGKERWKERISGTCWSTPVLVTVLDNAKKSQQEIVLSLPGKIAAYNPDTGAALWHCQGIGGKSDGGKGGGFGGGLGGFGGGYTSSTPVTRDGVVYVIGGGGPTAAAAAIAVKAGGKGDVEKTHVLWRARAGSSTCSPVLVGNHLCWVAGTVTCLDLASGKTVHNERLYDGRNEYVSAVSAGDKIYALTRLNGLYVMENGPKLRQLGHHEFSGDTSVFNASPAISDGRIYIRSNAWLYCVGKK